MSKMMSIEEAIAFPLADLLREVSMTQESVRVVLEAENEVAITPITKPRVKLRTFEGYVPDGWKDAIYEPKPSHIK